MNAANYIKIDSGDMVEFKSHRNMSFKTLIKRSKTAFSCRENVVMVTPNHTRFFSVKASAIGALFSMEWIQEYENLPYFTRLISYWIEYLKSPEACLGKNFDLEALQLLKELSDLLLKSQKSEFEYSIQYEDICKIQDEIMLCFGLE